MAKSIKLTVEYNSPIEDVWQALTDKEAMSEWLMPTNIEPKIGFEFEFRTKSYPGFSGIVSCRILEIKEKEKLSFSWSGGSLKETVVSFNLTAISESQTRLDFEHSGFEGFINSVFVRKILSNGWKKKILTQQLPKYLSK